MWCKQGRLAQVKSQIGAVEERVKPVEDIPAEHCNVKPCQDHLKARNGHIGKGESNGVSEHGSGVRLHILKSESPDWIKPE